MEAAPRSISQRLGPVLAVGRYDAGWVFVGPDQEQVVDLKARLERPFLHSRATCVTTPKTNKWVANIQNTFHSSLLG